MAHHEYHKAYKFSYKPQPLTRETSKLCDEPLLQKENSMGNTNIITTPMSICSGRPTLMKSMKVY